jgi:hypothetical protein
MPVPSSPVVPSRWGKVWEVISDLLIATALLWTLPLLLGAAGALLRFLFGAT